MTSTDLAVSYRVARYVTGEESLADLRRWLLPLVWELSEPPSDEVSQLASRIELRLAEFLNGHWTEDDLRELFQQLLPPTSGLAADLQVSLFGALASAPAEPVGQRTEFVRE